MTAKDEKRNFWTTEKQIILIISLLVIVIVGIYAISILSQPPSFEDTLIKSYESGESQPSLISSIDTYYNAEVNLTNAYTNASIAAANYDFNDGSITATEKENKINSANTYKQEQLGYLVNEKALYISYVNGQISAADLKKAIQNLKNQGLSSS